jgi:hypothetical protein
MYTHIFLAQKKDLHEINCMYLIAGFGTFLSIGGQK